MHIGEEIKKTRKNRKMTLKDLGELIGAAITTVSQYELGKVQPSVAVISRIADALNDVSLLIFHCQACPVRDQVLLKQFPDLNNIRRDPAVIAARLRKEMVEGAEALDVLTERFSDQDFKSSPDYQEVFEREMEQVVDVKRGIEILEFELIMASLHSSKDIQDIYDNQQTKCISHGHHKVTCESCGCDQARG